MTNQVETFLRIGEVKKALGDLCKKALPPTTETPKQVFGYSPPITPDSTQIPP